MSLAVADVDVNISAVTDDCGVGHIIDVDCHEVTAVMHLPADLMLTVTM